MNKPTIRSLIYASVATAVLGLATAAQAQTTLTIESWRNDDLSIWNEKIIPAFEKAHPDIKVVFQPVAPTEYDAALGAKLAAGTAGDIIACRPFDKSLQLFQKGNLTSVNDIAGMDKFSAVAKAGWSTDDGKTTFCVPVASVIHGFIYNKDAFDKLGIQVPQTEDEFFAALDKIKADGTYTAIDLGTKDMWEAATMGYQNIGPNYWHGEDGRLALIAGKSKLTDPEWVEPYKVLAKWAPYMGDGYKAQAYPDSQNLFSLGRAAIYPAGSWDISQFKQAEFKQGAFPPPVKKVGDTCYISDHVDIALGMNAASKNAEAAKTFLTWVATPEFASIYSNALPGFFSLQSGAIDLQDPMAKEFVSWRGKCKSTIRSTYQILSRGTPNLENETWVASANVLNGTATPDEAAKKLQDGLDSWYKPGK
ncbi:ABC transporter substrate-binding protein [Labrys wisconsinensis]|uniref:Probable sugar-binding periplasmic protein n=1 Tax=Labrys wisconsinensis TaxID=425677 RepID=A0ABU0JGB8_9HYPH|nr:ABC transporter substrate-binding protein [Labrys wisconsinensis]MDQ0472289.1 raffinose/stachyose/melibiose transport system substrate-binding protein [Labrys wisconsinensis]